VDERGWAEHPWQGLRSIFEKLGVNSRAAAAQSVASLFANQ
jgi:hypothetical protein